MLLATHKHPFGAGATVHAANDTFWHGHTFCRLFPGLMLAASALADKPDVCASS